MNTDTNDQASAATTTANAVRGGVGEAGAVRSDLIIVREREFKGRDTREVSYLADWNFGRTVFHGSRDAALRLTEEQAVLFLHRGPNRIFVRYRAEPVDNRSVHVAGMTWHHVFIPTNGPGVRLQWKAEAGARQTPMSTGVDGAEWSIYVQPWPGTDSNNNVRPHCFAIYHSGRLHTHTSNHYPTAETAMAAAAEALRNLRGEG